MDPIDLMIHEMSQLLHDNHVVYRNETIRLLAQTCTICHAARNHEDPLYGIERRDYSLALKHPLCYGCISDLLITHMRLSVSYSYVDLCGPFTVPQTAH